MASGVSFRPVSGPGISHALAKLVIVRGARADLGRAWVRCEFALHSRVVEAFDVVGEGDFVVSKRPWLALVRDFQTWCVRVEPMSLLSMARLERILSRSEISVDRAFLRLRDKMKIEYSLF